MGYYFNPMDYIYAGTHEAINLPLRQNETKESAADVGFSEIAKQTRIYLREHFSRELASAAIHPETREMLKREILHYVGQSGIILAGFNQEQLYRRLQEEILYYGPIQRALDDPAVTNIDINSYQYVYLERNGEEELHQEMRFQDEAHLEVVLNKMLMADGKVLTANEPHIDKSGWPFFIMR